MTNAWLTPPLNAVTQQGYVTLVLRVSESNAAANATYVALVYKTNSDGSSPVQIGQARGIAEAGTSAGNLTIKGHINGTLTDGQRLKVMLYTTSPEGLSQAAGYTASLIVEDAGNVTAITLPATVSQYVAPVELTLVSHIISDGTVTRPGSFGIPQSSTFTLQPLINSAYYTYGWPENHGLDLTGSAGSYDYALYDTVAGPVTDPGIKPYWQEIFVSRAITVATTLTGRFDLACWARQETSGYTATNVGLHAAVYRMEPNGTMTKIASGKQTGNIQGSSTTAYLQSWTITGSSTALDAGDALALVVWADDSTVGNMATGGRTEFYWDNNGVYSATSDSKIKIYSDPAVTFAPTTPPGTTYYLSNTASDTSGFKAFATSADGSDTDYVVDFPANLTSADWTITAGGSVLQWLSPMVMGVTLAGAFQLNVTVRSEFQGPNFPVYATVWKTDSAGNNAVEIGKCVSPVRVAGNTTTSLSILGQIEGTLATGERLRLRVSLWNHEEQGAGSDITLRVGTTNYGTISWPATLIPIYPAPPIFNIPRRILRNLVR